jgi:hypothetical protein
MTDATIDRRAAERLAVSPGAACTMAGQVTDLGPTKLRDVSMTGIGLVVSRRVEVGSLVVLNIASSETASYKFSKTVLVKIAHVTPTHGGFLVGGTLAEPLTYQEFTAMVM